jgi:hypothetical protein
VHHDINTQEQQQKQQKSLPGQLGSHPQSHHSRQLQQQGQHHATCRKGFHESDASRRLHEYMLAQQRRKEEFWLKKYGKLLLTAPAALSSKATHTQHHGSRYGHQAHIE